MLNNPEVRVASLLASLCALALAACGVGNEATLMNTEATHADDAAAELRAGTPNVILEEASLRPFGRGGAFQFLGSVLVKNLAYSKKVTIVYTTDGWATTRTLDASYQSAFQGGYDRWTFFQMAWQGDSFEFAVSYEVAGKTYWDNNDGRNYTTGSGVNNVPPLCAITYASVSANGELAVQVKTRDLAFPKSVKVSFDLEHQQEEIAAARFEKKVSPGIELWELSTRFSHGSTSPWPLASVQATCSMLGMDLGPSWTQVSFPGTTGARE